MEVKINLFIRKYALPCTWIAGFLTAAGLLFRRISSLSILSIPLFLAAAILAGLPILIRGIQGLRFRTIGIECLVSIAVLGACFIGEFSEAAIVTFLFQFGSFLEQKTMKKTRSAIRALTEMAPTTAWRICGSESEKEEAFSAEGSIDEREKSCVQDAFHEREKSCVQDTLHERGKSCVQDTLHEREKSRMQDVLPQHESLEEIDADEVEEGDLLLVKTGGKIAADGVVLQGEGYVNEASITGESLPQHKVPGSLLYGGTILDSGTLWMRASRVGEDTTFSRIIALVEEAQDAKSPAEKFIDRFAKYYTPAVVVMAALVLLFTHDPDTAITVLVLACPGALVIGAPIANVAGIGKGAREGILLKGGDSVHTFVKTDVVVFDKTGTLTLGQPRITKVYSYGDSPEQALALAASAEQASDHPLARAVLAYAEEQDLFLPPISSSEPIKGMGMIARTEEQQILVGSTRLMEEFGVSVEKKQEEDIFREQEKGATTILVSMDGKIVLLLSVSDAPKPDASGSMAKLKRLGIRKLVMMTGDHQQTAASVAGQIGITEYYGGLLPQDKLDRIRQMQAEHHVVTFVGDGINDSPALTAADTGIAMGSGTDAAIDCSDVVLIKSDLGSLCSALLLARRTVRIMYENIAIAVGTVVLLLIGLFAGYVHMGIGMLIHEASILVVIFNAMRLLL